MRDEQGFRTFAAERAGELRRQALLLTGSPADAVTLTEGALADTARRWHGLAPGAAEEHARRALATGAVRRNARRRGLLALLPAASRTRPPAPAGSGTPAAAGRTPAGGSDAAGARRGTGRPAGGGTAVAETGPTGAASDVAAAWRALGALPARRRAALVLRYDEGLDDAAIGARLGLSPAGAAAEQEAGLAALRSLLRLRGAPEQLVPAALAEAGRDVPAGDEVSTAIARAAHGTRRRRLATAVAGVAVLAAAAVVVPLTTRSDDPPATELPVAAPAARGLLAWPARGPLAGDADLLRSALSAWRAGVPAAQAPRSPAVLYAGSPDGTPVVLLQAVDATGLGWVAEVARPAGEAPALRRTEPISRIAPLFVLSTSDGDAVRLLAPTDSPRDGGLLTRPAGLADDAPLRPLPTDADGLSDPLRPGASGVPVVVVRGSGADSQIAGGGTVVADRLSPVAGNVEIGTARLGFGRRTDVRAGWYADGALVGTVLAGPVTVAALGPDLTATLDGGPVRARTYEVQNAGDTWVSSVVHAGPVACVDSSKLGAVPAGGDVPVVVRRCAPAGSPAGVLHVLAGREVAELRIVLRAAGSPPGSPPREVRLTVTRDTQGVRPAGGGFTGLITVAQLPTGTAEVRAVDAAGRPVAMVTLRAYRPPTA